MARPKIYKIDEDTFINELTPLTAYSLGLLCSDGHLSYKRGVIQYACKTEDEYLIGILLKSIKATHPIKRYKIKNGCYSRVSISNIKLSRSIIDIFELPNSNKSSNNLFVPKNIPADLMHHFLRGVFDGDGSIWKIGERFLCSYCGGESMMLDIQQILRGLNIKSRISYRYGKKNKNSCSLTMSSHDDVENLKTYLYQNADDFLERKKILFDEHTESFQRHKNRCLKYNGNGKKIENLYNLGKSQKEIADEISIPHSSVRAYVQLQRKKGVLV